MLSTFVCYGLKLIAVVLQQLLIGGRWGIEAVGGSASDDRGELTDDTCD
jgi:hypothetical protein